MIAEFLTHNDILHIDIIAVTTGTATGDNAVRMKLIDHTLGTQCRIHLADTTFLYQHITIPKDFLKLFQLLVHCHNDSYFHIRSFICLTAKVRFIFGNMKKMV